MEMNSTLKTKITEKKNLENYYNVISSLIKLQQSRQCDIWCQYEKWKINLDPIYPHPIYKINSIWIRDLNVRANIIKFLEENIGENLSSLEFGQHYFNRTKSTKNKGKKSIKWTWSKLESFALQKILMKEKCRPQTCRKHLQNIYLTSNLYLGYGKNCYRHTSDISQVWFQTTTVKQMSQ